MIDYSQYRMFAKCPSLWTENYIRAVQPARPDAQRDDPMTLGTLYHAGLQCLRQTGSLSIPTEVLAESRCSHTCYEWAMTLLAGYHRQFPTEHPRTYYCEAPLQFSLPSGGQAVAKIDSYFMVEEVEEMASGLSDGSTITLSPGWWIREYKTKASGKSTANYITQWSVNKQVDFQILALRAHLGTEVQGAVIDVAEKPAIARPIRMCKHCKVRQPFEDYLPTDGGYRCTLCDLVSKFMPVKDTTPEPPSYWRIAERRTAEQLQASLVAINAVEQHMTSIIRGEVDAPMNTEHACVDSIFGPCPYLWAHREQRFAEPDGYRLVQVENPYAYIGLP